MNKFVKGAKNLAFALSFVTIAACGVKKADLETLEKSFNEKIGKKADLDSCVSKNELTNINGEVEKKINDEISKMKGKMVSKEDVVKGCIKKGGVEFDFLKKNGVNLEGVKFEVSVVDGKVVIKSGDVVVFNDFKIAGVGNVEFIESVVSLGGEFVFDGSFEGKNKFKFEAANDDEHVKVGGFETGSVDDTITLIRSIGKMGKSVFESFFDRNIGVLSGTNLTIGGKKMETVWGKIEKDFEMQKEFGAGLSVLFDKEGDFIIGEDSDPKGLTNGKYGYVFKEDVGSVKAINLQGV